MYCIIAGSRTLTKEEVYEAINQTDIAGQITHVINGMHKDGGDRYGREWADERNIPVVPFPADWDNLDVPGAYVKERYDGTLYNAHAGFDRNEQMAQFAAQHNGHLIAIRKGFSPGTTDMIKRAKKHGLTIHKYKVE